jgi:hypothetical protein
MDKFKQAGRNLGRDFNSRCGQACLFLAIALITKTDQLKVEISAQTTFRFSPVCFHAPQAVAQQTFFSKVSFTTSIPWTNYS